MARQARRFKTYSPYTTAFKILKPTETKVKGVVKKTYPEPSSVEKVSFGSFRTYGGTDGWNNDVYTVIATAKVETWYDPNITSDVVIYLCETGEFWEVISRPEDLDMRHQYMQFKVQKTGGKP